MTSADLVEWNSRGNYDIAWAAMSAVATELGIGSMEMLRGRCRRRSMRTTVACATRPQSYSSLNCPEGFVTRVVNASFQEPTRSS